VRARYVKLFFRCQCGEARRARPTAKRLLESRMTTARTAPAAGRANEALQKLRRGRMINFAPSPSIDFARTSRCPLHADLRALSALPRSSGLSLSLPFATPHFTPVFRMSGRAFPLCHHLNTSSSSPQPSSHDHSNGKSPYANPRPHRNTCRVTGHARSAVRVPRQLERGAVVEWG
jgi:hypothetical protein